MRRQQQIDLARHRAGRHVDDARGGHPARLHVAQRRQRIGGLARLRHDDAQHVGRQHRIAIAVFGRDIDLDRHARQLLDPVFADHADIDAVPQAMIVTRSIADRSKSICGSATFCSTERM